ncbi:MAG TPA: serine hydrolase domain-containing protein, partial [Acidimicrobiales bacterium]|nr:serine hydrolase domain-containing protein [Acidimicrobiales bacterium]
RRLALETRLVTDTNVAHKYSNIGFSVLGEVIDAVTGSYHDYVLEHVVGTLGLSGTGPEWRDDLGLEAVTGYTRREPGTGRRPLPALDTRAMAPATGFYGTAGDLCRFFAAQRIGSGKLLSDDSKREMQRVHWRVERPGGDGTEDYGLGLQLQRLGERRTFGHSGGFPGQITRTMADPADRLVVAALTNCIDGPATDIVRAAYGVIDFFQQRPPPRAAAVALEGRYVCLWQAIDVVGSGARLAVGDPDTWQPLKDPDELERVSDDQWRVATTSSYGSPGESVRFELRGGRVEQVRYAGSTMWTEGGWPAARRKLLGEQ